MKTELKRRGRALIVGPAAVLGILLLSQGVLAQSEGEDDGGRELTLDRIAKALDLNEEQQAEWKELTRKHAETLKPISEEVRSLNKQIVEARGNDSESEEIESLLQQRKELTQKLNTEREAQDQELAGLLNGDQKQRFDRMMKARDKKDRDREGRDRARDRRRRTRN